MPQLQIQELTEQARNQGRPFKVLIVDDEKWVCEVFRDFCNLTDVLEVEMAANGVEAVEKAKATTYDLITLDLIMPELSGLEVLTSIKEIAPNVPVMVITGNATEKLVNEAGVLGACKVLYKPVLLETFLAGITSTLVKHS
jgi:DNA-binding NtrC family response regulator